LQPEEEPFLTLVFLQVFENNNKNMILKIFLARISAVDSPLTICENLLKNGESSLASQAKKRLPHYCHK